MKKYENIMSILANDQTPKPPSLLAVQGTDYKGKSGFCAMSQLVLSEKRPVEQHDQGSKSEPNALPNGSCPRARGLLPALVTGVG